MEVAVGIEVGRRVRGYTKDEMINDYLPAARMATELCRHSSVSHEFDDGASQIVVSNHPLE